MEKNELFSVVFVCSEHFATILRVKILKNEDCAYETIAVTLHPKKYV